MTYILITGGLGYIGSHICIELYKKTENIVLLDNFNNSKRDMKHVLLKQCPNIQVCECDLLNTKELTNVFKQYQISSVIHLAGFKSIGHSIKDPLSYYNNNISGTINLLNVMDQFHCYNMIFSSSATIYGFQQLVPIPEHAESDISILSPYGKTKLFIEFILKDLSKSNHLWNIIILRYFNPVGTYPNQMICENPVTPLGNLFYHIAKVYNKKQDYLIIHGDNYKTRDGTCIRDFIHILDLADAHIRSLEYFDKKTNVYEIFNIGTGIGYSILEVVKKFNEYTNNSVPYKIGPPREGDIPYSFAKVTKIKEKLNWYATRTLDNMVADSIG